MLETLNVNSFDDSSSKWKLHLSNISDPVEEAGMLQD
jgi:hypothetical protein